MMGVPFGQCLSSTAEHSSIECLPPLSTNGCPVPRVIPASPSRETVSSRGRSPPRNQTGIPQTQVPLFGEVAGVEPLVASPRAYPVRTISPHGCRNDGERGPSGPWFFGSSEACDARRQDSRDVVFGNEAATVRWRLHQRADARRSPTRFCDARGDSRTWQRLRNNLPIFANSFNAVSIGAAQPARCVAASPGGLRRTATK